MRIESEVLQLPERDLASQETALRWCERVSQFADLQQPDGSWGRFHCADSSDKYPIRTTEQAIGAPLATAGLSVLRAPRERWLEQQRDPRGWDFGRLRPNTSLPMSRDWHSPGRRLHNWSARVLLLLNRLNPPRS